MEIKDFLWGLAETALDVGAGFIPGGKGLKKMAKRGLRGLQRATGMAKDLMAGGGDNFSEFANTFNTYKQGFDKGIGDLKEGLQGMGNRVGGLEKGLEGMGNRMGNMESEVKGLGDRTGALEKNMGSLKEGLDSVRSDLEGVKSDLVEKHPANSKPFKNRNLGNLWTEQSLSIQQRKHPH